RGCRDGRADRRGYGADDLGRRGSDLASRRHGRRPVARPVEAAARAASARPAGRAGSAARPRPAAGWRSAPEPGTPAGAGPGAAGSPGLHAVGNADSAAGHAAAGGPGAGPTVDSVAVRAALAEPRPADAAGSTGPIGPAGAGAEPVR